MNIKAAAGLPAGCLAINQRREPLFISPFAANYLRSAPLP
jgi:hypothetical protein